MHRLVDQIQSNLTKLTAPNLVRAVLRTLIGAVSTAAGIGILFILIGEWGETQGKIMLSTLAAIGACLPSLIFARVFNDPNKRLFALTGFFFTALLLVNWLIDIWGGPFLNSAALVMGFILTATGCCFGPISARARRENHKSLAIFADLGILFCFIMSLYSAIAVFDLDNIALMTTVPVLTILIPLGAALPVDIYLSLEKLPQLKVPARVATIVTLASSALIYITQVVQVNLLAAFENRCYGLNICTTEAFTPPTILIRLTILASFLTFMMVPILLTEYLSNRKDREIYRFAALATLLVSTGIISTIILIGDIGDQIVFRLLAAASTAISLTFFLSVFLRIKPLEKKVNNFLWATTFATIALGLDTILIIFAADQGLPNFFVRLFVVLWILVITGSIIAPIMNRIARSKHPEPLAATPKKKLPGWAIALIILGTISLAPAILIVLLVFILLSFL